MMILLNSFWSGLAQRRTSIFESLQSCQHCAVKLSGHNCCLVYINHHVCCARARGRSQRWISASVRACARSFSSDKRLLSCFKECNDEGQT